MKITLRLDQLDSHAHFAVLIDGGEAGVLCIRVVQWWDLYGVLEAGAKACGHSFQIDDNRKKDRG